MIDTFEAKSFLSPAECAALRAEPGQVTGSQALSAAPESYGGGALVLHGPTSGPDLRVPPAPGTLICFCAETTHKVLPVTHGERFSIVSWYW